MYFLYLYVFGVSSHFLYCSSSDQDLPSLSQNNWVAMGVAIVSAAVMEAYTHQVDNLVLGVFLFSILIAFL